MHAGVRDGSNRTGGNKTSKCSTEETKFIECKQQSHEFVDKYVLRICVNLTVLCVCVSACVHACLHECVRACMRACVCLCVSM